MRPRYRGAADATAKGARGRDRREEGAANVHGAMPPLHERKARPRRMFSQVEAGGAFGDVLDGCRRERRVDPDPNGRIAVVHGDRHLERLERVRRPRARRSPRSTVPARTVGRTCSPRGVSHRARLPRSTLVTASGPCPLSATTPDGLKPRRRTRSVARSPGASREGRHRRSARWYRDRRAWPARPARRPDGSSPRSPAPSRRCTAGRARP